MNIKPVYHLFIPGTPKAQPRTRKGKYGNIYNPDSADNWKESIQVYFLQHKKDVILNPVIINATFYFYSKGRKESPHTFKPDIDNLQKSVLDSLKGIVYKDDCQVFKKDVGKYWTPDKEREGMLIEVLEVQDV
jgi:Holliday junction resolvase RusA-like endonuclease